MQAPSRHLRGALWGLLLGSALLLGLVSLGAPPDAYTAAGALLGGYMVATGASSARHIGAGK